MMLLVIKTERKYLMDNKLIDNNNYNIDSLFDNIKDMVINSRNRVYSAVNTEMLD